MNIRAINLNAITNQNPDISATIRKSTGYTINADKTRTPTYTDYHGIMIQVQGQMSAPELTLANALNIQGVKDVVYLPGNWHGIVRGDQTGGDIIQYAEEGSATVRNWLIVRILEDWKNWTKVMVCLQN